MLKLGTFEQSLSEKKQFSLFPRGQGSAFLQRSPVLSAYPWPVSHPSYPDRWPLSASGRHTQLRFLARQGNTETSPGNIKMSIIGRNLGEVV